MRHVQNLPNVLTGFRFVLIPVLVLILSIAAGALGVSPVRIARGFALAYLEFFRNTPLLVQIFFWYFGSYKILPAAGRLSPLYGLREPQNLQ